MADEELRDPARIEAALRYLELVQDAAVRAYNTAGRLFLLRIILTLILLMIAGGVAESPHTVDLLWFGIGLETWTVLVAGAVPRRPDPRIGVPARHAGRRVR